MIVMDIIGVLLAVMSLVVVAGLVLSEKKGNQFCHVLYSTTQSICIEKIWQSI